MAVLSFAKQSDGTWKSAEMSVASGTINIDVERKGSGMLAVAVKNGSASRYKVVKVMKDVGDVCFNFANDSSAGLKVVLVSSVEVEKAYYG